MEACVFDRRTKIIKIKNEKRCVFDRRTEKHGATGA
jgi:hypothetical protein